MPRVVNHHIHIFLFGFLCCTMSSLTGQYTVDSVSQPGLVKKYLLPTTLMTAGIIWNKDSRKTAFQESFRESIAIPDNNPDDYAQHMPIILLYSADLIRGVPMKRVGDHTKYLVLSEISTLTTLFIIKRFENTERPNGGDFSFPSGHTAHAFTGATVLFHTYKDHNKWIAYSGYVPAIFTAYYRIARNKHWISDVLFGAGLGILMPTLLHEFSWIHKDREVKGERPVTYQIGINPSGFGLSMSF